MLTKDKLASAACANDKQSDAGEKLPAVLRDVDLDPEGALYVSEQRALRWVLHERPDKTVPGGFFTLSPTEQRTLEALQAAWLDGAACVARAKIAQRLAEMAEEAPDDTTYQR